MGMPSMPELLILLGFIFLFSRLFTKKKVEKLDNRGTEQLEQAMQKIVNTNYSRDIIVNKLKKLMLPKGYKVTIEEYFIIQFKAKGMKTYNIDLEPYSHKDTAKKKEENPELFIFKSIIGIFTKVAKSDGLISREEADIIQDSINNFLEVLSDNHSCSSSELSRYREQLVQSHNNAKVNRNTISSYAQNLKHLDTDFKTKIIQQLIFVSTIDGYTTLKEQLIFEVGQTFGLMHTDIKMYIDNIVGQRHGTQGNENFDPYAVLNCKASDDNLTIKKQYRILIKKYHPDFIHSKGLDEAFVEFAKQKLQEINKAYEMIKKERNF